MFNQLKVDGLLFKGDERISRYSEDVVYQGNPDAVLVARDIQDIQEALKFCSAHTIPVTFCGSQTSLTGASVADSGLLISTERLEKILDIDSKKKRVTTQPGIIISDLKKAVAMEGLYYPPAPTSQDNARIGASIATNATGEDSYQYGTTRKFIREIKVLLANGETKVFSRGDNESYSDSLGHAGYEWESRNPLDYFIGSEGTLGFIYEATMDLVPLPQGLFSGLAPFASLNEALDFVLTVSSHSHLKPRAIELIDKAALNVMKTYPGFPVIHENVETFIYFKQEFFSEQNKNELLETWFSLIEKNSKPQLLESILIAETPAKQEEMRLWRHHIPAMINERARDHRKLGGGKISSDWWVPLSKIKAMIDFVRNEASSQNMETLIFAHIGQGHPHVNYIAKNADDKKKAEALLLRACHQAVKFGGGLSGEHGIGKIHRDYLPIQWEASAIERMKKIKTEFDPQWILGKGNIF